MGCFEDLMEFRENVSKDEKERKGKARLPSQKPAETANARE